MGDKRKDEQKLTLEIKEPEWVPKLLGSVERMVRPEVSRRKWLGIWFLDKLLPLLVAIGVAFSGFYFTRSEDRTNAQHEIAKGQLETDIEYKKRTYRELMVAMTGLRGTHYELQKECINNPQLANATEYIEKMDSRRFREVLNVVNAGIEAKFAFGNEMKSLIRKYISWDQQTTNVCAKNAPKDKVYQEKQAVIDDAMIKKIVDQEERLARLQ